ncbi:MAG: hypothetical protein IIT49_01925, partial [Clostridia bacterium]|nr:hypothetical protein [Clostridia bacterium]
GSTYREHLSTQCADQIHCFPGCHSKGIVAGHCPQADRRITEIHIGQVVSRCSIGRRIQDRSDRTLFLTGSIFAVNMKQYSLTAYRGNIAPTKAATL